MWNNLGEGNLSPEKKEWRRAGWLRVHCWRSTKNLPRVLWKTVGIFSWRSLQLLWDCSAASSVLLRMGAVHCAFTSGIAGSLLQFLQLCPLHNSALKCWVPVSYQSVWWSMTEIAPAAYFKYRFSSPQVAGYLLRKPWSLYFYFAFEVGLLGPKIWGLFHLDG